MSRARFCALSCPPRQSPRAGSLIEHRLGADLRDRFPEPVSGTGQGPVFSSSVGHGIRSRWPTFHSSEDDAPEESAAAPGGCDVPKGICRSIDARALGRLSLGGPVKRRRHLLSTGWDHRGGVLPYFALIAQPPAANGCRFSERRGRFRAMRNGMPDTHRANVNHMASQQSNRPGAPADHDPVCRYRMPISKPALMPIDCSWPPAKL
jgi:hypothetical protein